jgi:Outer membrane protein
MKTKNMVLTLALLTVPFLMNAKAADSLDNILVVDSMRTMRECEEGKKVAAQLEKIRDKFSSEIEVDAKKLSKETEEFESKKTTMKPEVAQKKRTELAKMERSLQEKVKESEEELRGEMQRLTESLAMDVENSIAQLARDKGADAVVDKMTGRFIYTNTQNKGDITDDAIAFVNKKDKEKTQKVAQVKDTPKTSKTA